MAVSITHAMQNVSKLLVLVALGACAAEPSAVRPGTGSGSDAGSGSDMTGMTGSGGSAQPPPPPGTLYGSVLDERGDKIDFSTGEPVHTHAGPAIDLAAGCPAVYKYAYLEDQTDPRFGRETAINPLAWHVMSQVGSLDDSATAYRVRLDDGTVVLDWSPAAAPDDTGLFTVRLYRDVVSAIGDHTGKMWVDVRFKDTSGNETVDSACWENHPMAAPLEVAIAATGDLFTWTLPAHSPISTAIDTASLDATATEQVGATVFTQNIVQHTAEPVTVHLDHSAITGTTSNEVVNLVIETFTRTEDASCIGVNADLCDPKPTAAAPATLSGALQATWDERIIDVASGAIVCHNPDAPGAGSPAIDGCVLPARSSAEAPHAYQIVYSMSAATSIAPTPGASASEVSIRSNLNRVTQATGSVTGLAWCASALDNTCSESATGSSLMALDKAHIDFNAFQVIVQTAPDATASLEAIGSYATPSLSIGAQSWDAGDAGLAP